MNPPTDSRLAKTSRRRFVAGTAGVLALAFSPGGRRLLAAVTVPSLNAFIEKVVLRRGRDGGGPTWFHPRACMVRGPDGAMPLMALQTISGRTIMNRCIG
ncbi:MAG: hypothetical protein IH623_23005 [Verrucomicrobia bacterium]|nr:hypothetical protein [Verrucomicrobiota bacterium]